MENSTQREENVIILFEREIQKIQPIFLLRHLVRCESAGGFGVSLIEMPYIFFTRGTIGILYTWNVIGIRAVRRSWVYGQQNRFCIAEGSQRYKIDLLPYGMEKNRLYEQ